jgi:RNA polymerase sigma-70 factor, ECF subfamily
MTGSNDDSELLILLQNDDASAFEKLFRLYHKRVFSFALRLLSSSDLAEDIVQNVFMAVWNQRKNMQISSSFITYLFGITRHMVYDFVRHKIQHEAFVEYHIENNKEYAFITDDQVVFHELEDRLQKYILELPERRREIFQLNRTNGLSYKEISEKLGITENTVDTQIRHALNYLRSHLLE